MIKKYESSRDCNYNVYKTFNFANLIYELAKNISTMLTMAKNEYWLKTDQNERR